MFTPSCTESKEKQSPSTHRKTQHDIQNPLLPDTTVSLHSLTKCPPNSCNTHKMISSDTHTNTDKRKLNARAHGQKQSFFFFFGLLTLRLYISVYLTECHSSLSLSDCHLWWALHRKTQLGFCSSPNHFTLSDPFCLPLRHVYPPISLSLADMIICCCIIKKNKSENLSCCFIREPQRLFSLCVSNTLSIMLHQCWKHNVVCLLQRKANLIQQSQRPCNYLLGYSFIDVRFVSGVCVCKFTVFLLSLIN